MSSVLESVAEKTAKNPQTFYEVCAALGYRIQFEHRLKAVERLIPSIIPTPFSGDSAASVHLMKHGIQSGLYLSLRTPVFPTCAGIQSARAVYSYLKESVCAGLALCSPEIQSELFLNIATGEYCVIQCWIDCPTDRGYVSRYLERSIAPVITGLSRRSSVDLTPWVGRLNDDVRHALNALSRAEWK